MEVLPYIPGFPIGTIDYFVKLAFKMGWSDRTLFLSKTFVGECVITLVNSLQGEGHNLWIHNQTFSFLRLNPLQCAYFIDTKLN